MNKYLGHWITEIVDIFYFLGGDVFSLCQFENVLFSVSDLKGAVLQQTGREKPWNYDTNSMSLNGFTHDVS